MKKVLIVDDEEFIREFMEEFFKRHLSFDEVSFANDGLEAFTKSSVIKYDIICTDHQMPFMKGAEFLLALRQKKGPNQKTPVILVSSYIPDILSDLQSIENVFFIEKPVDFQRLTRYVKMAIPENK